VIDALGQRSEWRDALENPDHGAARRRGRGAPAPDGGPRRRTKVDFFTVAREAGT